MKRRDKKLLRKLLIYTDIAYVMTYPTTFEEFLYHEASHKIGISLVQDTSKISKQLSPKFKKHNGQIQWDFLEKFDTTEENMDMEEVYFNFTKFYPELKLQIKKNLG